MAISPDAFRRKVEEDLARAKNVLLLVIGERQGIFDDLSWRGPATTEELAARVGLVGLENKVEMWADQMVKAGYLEKDAAGKYFLPKEYEPVLTREGEGGINSPFMGREIRKFGRQVGRMTSGPPMDEEPVEDILS